MDPHLEQLIFERLAAEDGPADAVAQLVLAACEGPGRLAAALDGSQPAPDPTAEPLPLPVAPPAVHLAAVSVEGFRGIGPRVTLDIPPGPGLTLVVGRNGSGKSSLAEGLELLLTGVSSRWASRSKVWSEAWRNLHHEGATELRAELTVDGDPKRAVVRRRWPEGSDLGDHATEGLDERGWDAALLRYRPLLSYAELGAMWEDPKTVYDALAAILGLEDVDAVHASLRDERLHRGKLVKGPKEAAKRLLGLLEGLVGDERASVVATELGKRTPDLDTIELATQDVVEDEDVEGDLMRLRALARLARPTEEAVQAAYERRERAREAMERTAETDAGRDGATADLLDQALAHHRDHGDEDCPVCGAGALDDAWAARAAAQVRELRERSRAYTAARSELLAAERAVAGLLGAPPAVLAGDDPLREAWTAWTGDPAGLATVLAAIDERAAAAAAEIEQRNDAWRPVRDQVIAWLPQAREAVRAKATLEHLEKAEGWMKDQASSLRAERLKPIAARAQSHWERLRHESNVALGDIVLKQAGTRRSASFEVTVDGTDTSALGVMSQGELNALAISLFLPRACLDDSPFRFVVIDDPVQSMDPAKVDGLARVLAEAAGARQVVVFTHDERLPEAARRLDLPHTTLRVTRRAGSVVEIRRALDPVSRAIDDALAIVNTDTMDEDVARRVVPGFCREALEAAADEAVRRRRLGRGEHHAAVEDAILGAMGVRGRLALAMFDDAAKAGSVSSSASNRWGPDAMHTIGHVASGAHGPHPGDLKVLVDRTRDLAALIRALT